MKGIIRKLKLLLKAAVGKEYLVKPSIICTMERFGSDYGGWDVVTSNINTRSIVYSFGVGSNA